MSTQENAQTMRRGNHAGEHNGHAVLSAAQAREIKKRALAGDGQGALARAFGVNHATVSHIARGRTWSCLDRPEPEPARAAAAPRLSAAQRLGRRFWAAIEQGEGCWEWQRGTYPAGYGSFWANGKSIGAHRMAWTLTYGPIAAGLCVCHRCDNPRCCRPDHLFLASGPENTADKVRKGRGSAGSRHGMARLSADQVATIRTRYTGAPGQKAALARAYGLSKTHIGRILRGTSWRSEP